MHSNTVELALENNGTSFQCSLDPLFSCVYFQSNVGGPEIAFVFALRTHEIASNIELSLKS